MKIINKININNKIQSESKPDSSTSKKVNKSAYFKSLFKIIHFYFNITSYFHFFFINSIYVSPLSMPRHSKTSSGIAEGKHEGGWQCAGELSLTASLESVDGVEPEDYPPAVHCQNISGDQMFQAK